MSAGSATPSRDRSVRSAASQRQSDMPHAIDRRKPASRTKRSKRFSPRATSRLADRHAPRGLEAFQASAAARRARRRMDADRHPRCSGSISFGLPGELAGRGCTLPAGPADARRRTGRPHDVALDSRPGRRAQLDRRTGRAGRALRQPRRAGRRARRAAAAASVSQVVDSAADKFAALHAACWSGGTLLYVPRGVVIDEPLHMLSALSAGGVDFGHALVDPRRRGRSDPAGRDRRRRRRRRRLALRGDRDCSSAPAPGCATSTCRTGAPASGTSPIRRPLVDRDGRAAMDHRRPGQPAGQGQPARGAGRRGRRRPGQRRDVHRGQAAPLLSHAAAPSGAALQQRSALQRRPAGPIAHRSGAA